MADETTIKWLYPPNFEGTFPPGTKNGFRRYIVQCDCESDGTGEDDAIKVHRTDLLTSAGNVPSALVIERVDYDVSGMTLTISYNNMNDETVGSVTGASTLDFTPSGGFMPQSDDGETGDIVFNTSGVNLGDTYSVTLTVRAKD